MGASAPVAMDSDGTAAAAAPKAETAAEKLARLRAKQAARMNGSYVGGTVGSDYASSGAPPVAGLLRYQQLVREGRR